MKYFGAYESLSTIIIMYAKDEQRRLFDLSKQFLAKNTEGGSNLEAAALVMDLRAVLRYHEWRYYIMDDPQISDYEYDTLFKKLEHLEDLYPELMSSDSPTVQVGSDITEEFKTVPHLTPMLSLENSYNAEDLLDFDKQIKKLADMANEAEIAYCVEPKFDGGTIALVYEDDVLTRAATRGNGVMGEEMTNNAKVMRSIPLKAAFSKSNLKKVELRGEALIRKDNFDKINKQREVEGLSLFANPRNAATGGLRTKDPKETKTRGIEAFIYQLGFAENREGVQMTRSFNTHHESIEFLGSLGFKVPKTGHETKVCKNIQEVIDFCNAWQEKRDSYEYEIDGIVVKVNSLDIQSQCGYTSHHPRWAVAFKFKAKQATSTLLDVEFQVGKIGTITPVAKLQPVALAGVTVSSVSLHNEDFITSKDIRIGDQVLVERAGDVIPYIVKPLAELRTGAEKNITFPEICPFDETKSIKLIREDGEAAWRCPTCTCGRQDYQKYVFHTSKDAMDIEGLSKATIERFMQLGWLKSIADLYRLDYAAISKLEGFGKKSADNLEKAIEKAKKNPIQRLLHSLSVHHLGKKAGKLLAAEIEHVLDLKDWDTEKFTAVKEIGPVVAQNVIEYFNNERNISILIEMESLGVNMKPTEEDRKPSVNTEGVLAGKSILFTGSLMQFTRDDAEKAASKVGASIASSVSKNLSILVVGEKAGSKLKKAQDLGTVQIMTEQEFVDLIS
jgi:DNA ligase (NAD+)